MATLLQRPVEGYTTMEDALGGIFGKLEQLEQGQQRIRGDVANVQGDVANVQGDLANVQGDLANVQGDLANVQGDLANVQGGLEALAQAHGNFATKVLTILGQELQSDKPAPPGVPRELLERHRG